MTEQEREELIEKMAREISRYNYDTPWQFFIPEARAALAVAEPVIREQADIALRAELAAVTERMSKLDFERTAAELERDALREENARLREALIDILASLVASVDLLERGGKKAAPSDKMFAQMLVDYKNSIERGRAVAAAIREGGKDD